MQHPTTTRLHLLAAALLLATLATHPATAQAIAQRMIAEAQSPSTEADRARARAVLPPDPHRQFDFIRPADTNPAIATYLLDHVAITYPSLPQNGRLMVFLPGTFARPVGYLRFQDTAARMGYHVIGLEYVDAGATPATSTVMQACGHGGDLDCPGSVRAARAFGGEASDGESIAPPEGIVPRLTALLHDLDHQHPQAGWGAFLTAGNPDWSRIVLTGHSQGAGMAAFLARKYPVARVVLLSGGADGNPRTRQPAAWVAAPSATPPDRWFAMVDAEEPREPLLLAGLALLGLPGDPIDWSGPGSLAGAHIAVVDLPPRAGGPHESTAADMATPEGPEGPAYAPLWRALLGS